MFNIITAAYKIATNASAGFNILTSAINDLKETIADIDGHEWEGVRDANSSLENYDQKVFYATACAIESFPSSLGGLFSIDTVHIQNLMLSIDPDCVPEINSEKTYQLGLAVDKLSAIRNKPAVKEIIEGLVQANLLQPTNLDRRQELLKSRIQIFEQFRAVCHRLDKFQDEDLLSQIRQANNEKVVNELLKKISNLEEILKESNLAFSSQKSYIDANQTPSIIEMTQHYSSHAQRAATLIKRSQEAINNKNEKYVAVLHHQQDCVNKITLLTERMKLESIKLQKAKESLSDAQIKDPNVFADSPNLPSLLRYTKDELITQLNRHQQKIIEACEFFKALLKELSSMGTNPVKLTENTRKNLIDYLNLDLCEDIPSLHWQSLIELVEETLDENDRYDANWFSRLQYQSYYYFSGDTETDAQFLYEVISDKLSFYESQLNNVQFAPEESYVRKNEFLTLEQYRQAIAYQQKYPQRLAVQTAMMNVVTSDIEYQLLTHQCDILKLEGYLDGHYISEHNAKENITHINDNVGMPTGQLLSLLTEIIRTYGQYHPEISEYINDQRLNEQKKALQSSLKNMELLIKSDPVGGLRQQYQHTFEGYQQRLQMLEKASHQAIVQAEEYIENEKSNLRFEKELISILTEGVFHFEKSELSGIELINNKKKFSELLSLVKSKYHQIHLEDPNNSFDIQSKLISTIEQLQRQVDAIKEPSRKQSNLRSKSLFSQQPSVYTNLYYRYFGYPEGGLFEDYLHKRAEKYFIKDILRNIAAIFLGCFGYQTDQSARQQFIEELKGMAHRFFSNPQNAGTQQQLQSKINDGYDYFIPRSKPKHSGYENSLHALLTGFERDLKPFLENKRQLLAQI